MQPRQRLTTSAKYLNTESEYIEAILVDGDHQLFTAGGRGVTFGYIPVLHMSVHGLMCRAHDEGVESALVDEDCVTLVVRTWDLNQGCGFVLTIDVYRYRVSWYHPPLHAEL